MSKSEEEAVMQYVIAAHLGEKNNVTEEQKKDLEKEINKVIHNWLDRYDLRDYGFLIEDMEMVRV